MTVGLADPLRMLTFSIMNTNKATNDLRVDRPERAAVAGLQLRTVLNDTIDIAKKKTGKIAGVFQGISHGIKSGRSASSTFDVLCKGVNFAAERLVNPILCLASVVRAYNSEDKKSAAIRELGAMSFMLGGERAYKHLFGLRGLNASYKNIKVLNKGGQLFKTFVATNKYLSKLPSNGVFGIVKAAGFIITSCGMFALGGKIGKSVADKTTAKAFEEKKALQSNGVIA